MEDSELADLVREFRTKFEEVGEQFREAFGKVAEDVQHQIDKEMGKAMAKHPEVYAELRKGDRSASAPKSHRRESDGP